jgi:membrane protease subunit HflC
MSLTKIIGIIISICVLYVVYSSIYTVSEGYTALLSSSKDLENANPRDDQLLRKPGLHFKLPFFTQVTLIDRRVHHFSSEKLSLVTRDQQPLVINYYALWQVTQPIVYYLQTHNDPQKTREQLTQKINMLLQQAFAQTTGQIILSSQQVSLLNTLVEQVNRQVKTLGVTLVGVGFKSIDFPAEANTAILKDRRNKQLRIALEQRAIGKAKADYIRISVENRVALQLAKATEEAANIRSQGDASAAKIYSEAYRKNPQFAAFYLQLEAYRKGFSQSSSRHNVFVFNMKEIATQTPPKDQ